jgi:chromosome segregation protein
LLRDSSQLIIITHQKFTMESADALYGVSMRGDGITQVISQRIRSVENAGVVVVDDVHTGVDDGAVSAVRELSLP